MPSAFSLFGELRLDTGRFSGALRDADAALLRVGGTITRTEQTATALGKTSAVTGRAFDRMREVVAATRERLAATADAFLKGDASANQMRSALVGAEKASERLNSRLADSSARLTDFANRASEIPAKLQAIGQTMTSVGTKLSLAITAPVALLGKSLISAGAEYETALNVFEVTTKATADQMTKAQKVAKDLGADLSLPATSAKDAALAMVELGKAGLSAQQAMDGAKGVLQLAAAAQVGEAQAAEIASNALNAFNLNANETGRVADLLAAAANASSAEITDVALAMQQASATFSAAHVPIETLTAAIAEMANAGIKSSDAGTSLKTFLQRLTPSSNDAAEAMADLGVKTYDAQGKMKAFPEIIGQFQKALAGLSDEQKATKLNAIFGTDAIRAAQILFRTGAEGLNSMQAAITHIGSAAELANAKTKGLGGAWKGLQSQLETIGITVYDAIKTPLTDVVKVASDVVGKIGDAFAKLPSSAQAAIVAFTAIAAAVGPVLVVVGTLATVLAPVAGAISAIVGAAGGFVPLVGIIAGVGAALTGLVAASAALYAAWETNFGGLRETTLKAWEAIKSATQAAMSFLYELTQSTGARLISWWSENYSKIQGVVTDTSERIKAITQSFLTAVQGFWTEHGAAITAYLQSYWETVSTIVSGALTTVGNVISVALDVIRGDWGAAWNDLLKMVSDFTASFTQAFISFGDVIRNLLSAIIQIVVEWGLKFVEAGSQALVGLVKLIANLPAVLFEMLPLLITAGEQLGAAIWKGIKKGLAGADDVGASVGGSVLGQSSGWLDNLLQKLTPGAVGGPKEGGGSILTAINNQAQIAAKSLDVVKTKLDDVQRSAVAKSSAAAQVARAAAGGGAPIFLATAKLGPDGIAPTISDADWKRLTSSVAPTLNVKSDPTHEMIRESISTMQALRKAVEIRPRIEIVDRTNGAVRITPGSQADVDRRYGGFHKN
nr:phage tail length tape-measure protein [uncultured bacterium]